MTMLERIGLNCKALRKSKGYTLEDVSRETGYTQTYVCAFEHGRSDNVRILVWYFKHGLTKRLLLKGVTFDGEQSKS